MNNYLKSIKELINKILCILSKNDKRYLLCLLIINCIGSGFEILGISAALPFIQAMTQPQKIKNNIFGKYICDLFDVEKDTEIIVATGLILFAIYIVKNGYLLWAAYIQSKYSAKVQENLSVRMFSAYVNKDYNYFLSVDSANVLRACSTDVYYTYIVISKMISLVTELITFVSIGIFIIIMDPFIAMGTIVFMLLVLWALITFFKPNLKKAGQADFEIKTKKNKIIVQTIFAIKEIIVMNRRDYFINQFKDNAENEKKTQTMYGTLMACPDRIVEAVCFGGVILLICIKIVLFPNDILSFIEKMAVFALAAFRIIPSISKFSTRISEIMFHQLGLNNVYNMLKDDCRDKKNENQINNNDKNIKFDKSLKIKNVSWTYSEKNNPTINHLSLEIRKGESVAIVGSSGAGKTTLVDIILGLLKPQEGTVEADGIDVFSRLEGWAKIVGYVPQNICLIDDTIRNNIKFGNFQNETDDVMIWDALKKAQLDEFIRDLPDGLDTVVGERGVKLSGGQKQRIVIARVLYTNPDFIIFDEATSALDNETESEVMAAIEKLKGTVTMIVVAHRLSTTEKCNRIYEVKEGKISVVR